MKKAGVYKFLKTSLLIIGIICLIALIYVIFNNYEDNTKYTLDDLHILLSKTDHIVKCQTLEDDSKDFCEDKDIVGVVKDKEKIQEIITLILESKEQKDGKIEAIKIGKTYFFDENDNVLLYIQINPYLIIGKEKDNYVLDRDNVPRISELLR